MWDRFIKKINPSVDIFDELKCQKSYKNFIADMVWLEHRKLDGIEWRINWLKKRNLKTLVNRTEKIYEGVN